MAKMSAPAPDGDRRAGRAHTVDAAAGERTRRTPALDPALDPEMLDIVQRFERGYAELAPAVEEPARQAPASDELFPEFPDVFDEPPPARPAHESARVFAMPRRDAEPASATPAWPRETPASDRGTDVDLDEAMAILRASEQRAAGAPPADAEPQAKSPPPRAASAWRSDNVSVRYADPAAPQDARPASTTSWASRSHAARSLTLAAAVAALAVAVGAGYFFGRGPSHKAPSAVIESSGQGTQLKLDRQLHPVQ